jgi:hypothetical protein
MGHRGKVYDDIDSLQEHAPVDFACNIPDCDPVQTGRIGGWRACAPHHSADRVAAREQPAAKSSADETRRTGDENAHVEPQGKAAFPSQSDTGF